MNDENPTRHFEGWDDDTGDAETVRRFAVPPYRWVVVEKSRFPAEWKRREPEAFEQGVASA